MAFTLAGFYEAGAAAVTGTNITGVADAHLKNESDAIIIPELNRLLGIHAGGQDLANVQVVSPSLRRTCLLDVSPVESTEAPASPPDPCFAGSGAPTLDFDEELTINADYGGDSTPIDALAVIFLGDNNCNPVSGQMYTIKAALAATTGDGTWNNATLTLSQSLPVGNYKIVGARCENANAFAFRFVFIGGIWRPGNMCVADDHAKDVPKSRYGELGVWGSFAHNREPGVEILGAVAAAAASTIYIDIMRA